MAYLQGFMELFNDASRLVIKMFKRKNVPIEKWLPLMWESRSLSHALCVSPVNEEFIMNSMDEFSELSNIDFWIRYLQGNQSSLIGFQQNFSFLFASSHKNSCSHGSSFQTDITIDEVQKAALDLISNVRLFWDRNSHNLFLSKIITLISINLPLGSCPKSFYISCWVSFLWFVPKTCCKWTVNRGK